MAELFKDEHEDDRREEWLEHGPRDTKVGLLVADEDIAPSEEQEQFAVAPQLREVDRRESPPRTNYAFENLCCGRGFNHSI